MPGKDGETRPKKRSHKSTSKDIAEKAIRSAKEFAQRKQGIQEQLDCILGLPPGNPVKHKAIRSLIGRPTRDFIFDDGSGHDIADDVRFRIYNDVTMYSAFLFETGSKVVALISEIPQLQTKVPCDFGSLVEAVDHVIGTAEHMKPELPPHEKNVAVEILKLLENFRKRSGYILCAGIIPTCSVSGTRYADIEAAFSGVYSYTMSTRNVLLLGDARDLLDTDADPDECNNADNVNTFIQHLLQRYSV